MGGQEGLLEAGHDHRLYSTVSLTTVSVVTILQQGRVGHELEQEVRK